MIYIGKKPQTAAAANTKTQHASYRRNHDLLSRPNCIGGRLEPPKRLAKSINTDIECDGYFLGEMF